MTVSSTTNRASFNGNGSTTVLPFTFKVFSKNDVKVYQTDGTTESLLTEITHYTITVNGDQEASPGGSVTMVTAPPVGYTTVLLREITATQETDLVNGGAFYAQNIETAFDKLTMLFQQLNELIERAVTIGVTGSGTTIDDLIASVSASAASAAATLDSFDDRYLGAKAADPSVDNDGGILVTGAIYFNTLSNEMRVWTGSAWQATATITSIFFDTSPIVQGSSDTTKRLRFEVDGFTTGQTRVITPPDADAVMAGTNLAQNWTLPQRAAPTTDNDLSFDLTVDNNFACTPTAGGTLTFTNIASASGQSGSVLLVNGANYTIAKAATVKADASFLSTISTTGTYRISYYCNGTDVFVTTSQALS